MYLKFYKLREYPFSITCDERYFYESPVHAEAQSQARSLLCSGSTCPAQLTEMPLTLYL